MLPKKLIFRTKSLVLDYCVERTGQEEPYLFFLAITKMSLKSRKLQDCLLTFRPNVNLASAFSFQQILVASPRLTSHRLAEHKGNNFTSPRNLSCCSNKSISLRRPSIKAESLHSCTTWKKSQKKKIVLTYWVFTENFVEIFDFPRFRFPRNLSCCTNKSISFNDDHLSKRNHCTRAQHGRNHWIILLEFVV